MAAAVTVQTSGLFPEFPKEQGIKPIPVAHHVITDGDLNSFYQVKLNYLTNIVKRALPIGFLPTFYLTFIAT